MPSAVLFGLTFDQTGFESFPASSLGERLVALGAFITACFVRINWSILLLDAADGRLKSRILLSNHTDIAALSGELISIWTHLRIELPEKLNFGPKSP